MPQIVVDLQGELDVEYTGPLPRAQRMEVVQATNMWIGNTMALQEVAPEVLDIIDFDLMARDTAKLSGLPAKYLKSKDDVKVVREDRQAQQKAMLDNENARAEGEAKESQGKGEKALMEAGLGQ